jgi:glycosyltransferase involved in cell wall biosynthesis
MPRDRLLRVGYIVRRFPVLSETFVLNEILDIEDQGASVEIFSLLQPRDPRFHPGVARIRGSIRYLPGLVHFQDLWRYNRRAAERFGSRYWQMLGYCASRFKISLLWRFFEAAYVAERAADRKLSHLHAHFANRTATVAKLAADLAGISYSFTAHAFDIYKSTVDRRVLAAKIRQAAFVVAVSEVGRRDLAELSPDSESRIHRIYNGIDLQRFSAQDRPVGRRPTILSVARLQEKKGLADLVEACGLLKSRGIDFRCRIVGQGRLRPALKAQIESLDLEREVKLVGVMGQDEIISEYATADIFVLPCVVGADGNRDGLPVSIVEAQASGLPVVTTAVSGTIEAVDDRTNGVIIPQRSPELLAARLRELIEHPERRRALGRAARASAESRFDRRETSAQLCRLFATAVFGDGAIEWRPAA